MNMKALTAMILILLTTPLLISQIEAQEVYLVEIEVSMYMPETYISIIDNYGNLVMQYKTPTNTFKIQLPRGNYIFYAEIRAPDIRYVGYVKAKVYNTQKIKLVLSNIDDVPRREIKINLGENVDFLRIYTPAGYILFETKEKTQFSISIPVLPVFIEVCSDGIYHVFFCDPSLEISSLNFSENEKRGITDLEEAELPLIVGTTKASEIEVVEYDSELRRLDILKVFSWTTSVFLISLFAYVLSRKLIGK